MVATSAAAACALHSGPQRVVLVELYTSEGCNSCPPADRWLRALPAQAAAAEGMVALAFHVDYWNQLGWTDRFSQPAFSARQRGIAARQNSRVIYTPQIVVDGKDLRGWSDADQFAARVAAVRREPPSARIDATADLEGNQVRIRGSVQVDMHAPATAFVALTENGLSSEVSAGENAGRLLQHAYVVRALTGPLHPDAQGTIRLEQALRTRDDWDLRQVDVVVFVQSPTTGRVLQAAASHACLR